ncbi:MAG: hypothetical protein ACJ8CR_02785 [Roseiflexaceae bacterium]
MQLSNQLHRDAQPAGDDLLATLAQTNNFSLGALAANRAGRLAPEQVVALQRRAIYRLVFGAVCIVVASLIPILFGSTAGLIVFGSGVVVLIGGIAFFKAYKTFADSQDGKVEMIEGHVTRHMYTATDTEGESTTYYYVIDKRRFEVSAAAFQALAEGRRYRLYYAPGSGDLLSIEPAPYVLP